MVLVTLSNMEFVLLNSIDSPDDLKKLSVDELPQLCAELRQYIIEQCAVNPGHLASSLGAVELAVAIHYVYDVPNDNLVWDVGHQAYAHKILTGRREAFKQNRKLNGLSGFPKMDESRYDSFGAGHSSISISAAYGLAKAQELNGRKGRSIAVIGDGAMTGGLAFEGMNNAGTDKFSDLLVILNDNNMSIDRSQGALNRYLLKMSTSKRYNRFKQRLWSILSVTPHLLTLVRKTGNAVKYGLLQNSNLFESFGFRYFGRIDGHDVVKLVETLRNLKEIHSPKLLHVITKKGYGFAPAGDNLTIWHAPGRFNPQTGEREKSVRKDKFQDVFGQTLIDLADIDKRVVGITPAMPTGCSMNLMMEKYPKRCFDVGIAESHAVTFSAGLAAGGMHPFCNIYSSFMQRAYDNVIHDVALQKLPVTFCLDRGGLVGEDGATHHGVFDIAYMTCVPNLVVSAPSNEAELRNILFTALNYDAPFVVRYPRGSGPCVEWRNKPFEMIKIGESRKVRDGEEIAIIALGPVVNAAVAAAEKSQHSVAVYDLRFAKPLDEQALHQIFSSYRKVITIEDGVIRGGVGEAIIKFMNDNGYSSHVVTLGVRDAFIEHGTLSELHHICGYDEESILSKIEEMLK